MTQGIAMHPGFRSAALCVALLLSMTPAAAREPTPQELAEFKQLIDTGDLAGAEDLIAQYFFDGIEGTAIDVQVVRLRYFKKEFKDAFTGADRVLAADPRNTDALNLRGLAKIELQDPVGALADFDAAIAIDPAFSKAYINRARLFCAQRRFDEADKAYGVALEHVPDKAGVFQLQFDCHFAAGRFHEAIDVATDWVMSKADYAAFARLAQAEHATGEHKKAYQDYLKAHALYGSNNDFRSVTARIFLDIGTPQLALDSFNEQIAETPGNPHLYLDRGEAYDMLGRDEEALADYDRGFAQVGQAPPPKRGRQMALRGAIKLERGDVAGATADFDRAIADDPNDPVGWFWRGELWMRSGNHDKAIAAYQAALKVLPDDKTYLAALAKAEAAKQ